MGNIREKALKYATMKHRNQKRIDGTPYISHPITVASYASEFFANDEHADELVAAAFLHDVLEDTNTTFEEIRRKFGLFIACLVLELTNNDDIKNLISKPTYLSLKMVNMSYYGLCLKLLDRRANVEDLVHADDAFVKKYVKETIKIINYLKDNRALDYKQMEIINTIEEEINGYEKTGLQLSAA